MAAYAALVSLTHILDQTLHPPPLNKIIIHRKLIESLRDKVTFLMDFLETYSSRRSQEIEDLETKITDAAYAAEDMIESQVVSQIREKYAIHIPESSALLVLCQGIRLKAIRLYHSMRRKFRTPTYKGEIRRMIKIFHSIGEELVQIKDKKGIEDPQPSNSVAATSPTLLPSGKNTMVGFDDQLLEIMSALTTFESNRVIIPIVGMGGIGKTTLATNVFNNLTIKEHFPIRAWVTVSQVYTLREILLGLLHHINIMNANEQRRTDDQLGDLLYKELFGRKYLIVMDDFWDIQDWDDIKRFLPPNNDGSRILITTRLSNLALDFGTCNPYEMKFLDDVRSWDLLREKVFGEDGCPNELEEIGKSIAKRCRGLPLALVVIGGLLANSKRTREHWRSVEEDVTSAINSENDDHFMKILSLSYSHLPIYLKPCFLYLAMFPADFKIKVSKLVRLWVAEGIIKPTGDKTLEEIAHEYLVDLINRNLVLVSERGSRGEVKSCSIHHLIWDLCRREAHKQKFLHIEKFDSPNISPHIERERRISIQPSRREEKLCDP